MIYQSYLSKIDISKFILLHHDQITQTISSKITKTAQDIFLTGMQLLTKKVQLDRKPSAPHWPQTPTSKSSEIVTKKGEFFQSLIPNKKQIYGLIYSDGARL